MQYRALTLLYSDIKFEMISPYRLQACDSIHEKKAIVMLITLFRIVNKYNIKVSDV